MTDECLGWTTDSTTVATDAVSATTDGEIDNAPGSLAPIITALVEERLCRVKTNFRESENLLGLIKIYLDAVAEPYGRIASLPCYFDLDTAVGEQLTFIGKAMGFGRCHCSCFPQPVFGFVCPDGNPNDANIVGFCEGATWASCNEVLEGDICLVDDETYRKFLYVRRYQINALYDYQSLTEAARLMWGDDTVVLNRADGSVVIWPRRHLTDEEEKLLPIAFRVLPIPPGIQGRIHKGVRPIFGFGTGWGGFCDGPPDTCEPPFTFCDSTKPAFCVEEPAPQTDCAWTFGFCDPDLGFCEGDTPTSDWICAEDPHPYSCGPEAPVFGFSGDGKTYAGFCQGAAWNC